MPAQRDSAIPATSGIMIEPDAAAVAPDGTTSKDTPKDGPKETGGRSGPDPTRYGDWEKNGRCIDF